MWLLKFLLLLGVLALQAVVSTLPPVTECGGLITGQTRTINFKRLPVIETSLWCIWEIVVDGASSLTFTFDWMDLARLGESCKHTLLIAEADWTFSGHLVEAGNQTELCRPGVPAPATVAGGRAFVSMAAVFVAGQSSGFGLHYTADMTPPVVTLPPPLQRCGGLLLGSNGVLDFTQEPAIPEHLWCSWVISVPEAASITLSFSRIDLAKRGTTGCKQLMLLSEGGIYHRSIVGVGDAAMYCRKPSLPPDVTLYGDHAYVSMLALYEGRGSGFTLSWSSSASVPHGAALCGGHGWLPRTVNGDVVCFKYFAQPFTFAEAQAVCDSYDSTIASGCSQDALSDILDVSQTGTHRLWTNLMYKDIDNKGVWVDAKTGSAANCNFGWHEKDKGRNVDVGSCAVIDKRRNFPNMRIKKDCYKRGQVVCQRPSGPA